MLFLISEEPLYRGSVEGHSRAVLGAVCQFLRGDRLSSTTRTEYAQETPTQSHVSPSVLEYEEK